MLNPIDSTYAKFEAYLLDLPLLYAHSQCIGFGFQKLFGLKCVDSHFPAFEDL